MISIKEAVYNSWIPTLFLIIFGFLWGLSSWINLKLRKMASKILPKKSRYFNTFFKYYLSVIINFFPIGILFYIVWVSFQSTSSSDNATIGGVIILGFTLLGQRIMTEMLDGNSNISNPILKEGNLIYIPRVGGSRMDPMYMVVTDIDLYGVYGYNVFNRIKMVDERVIEDIIKKDSQEDVIDNRKQGAEEKYPKIIIKNNRHEQNTNNKYSYSNSSVILGQVKGEEEDVMGGSFSSDDNSFFSLNIKPNKIKEKKKNKKENSISMCDTNNKGLLNYIPHVSLRTVPIELICNISDLSQEKKGLIILNYPIWK